MPRPVDETRRIELVEKCLLYFASHGLAGASLRPMAAALGTSDRMLIHYFGTKDVLIERVLELARPDVEALVGDHGGDIRGLAHAIWDELSQGGPQQPRVRVLLEVMTLALTRPDQYGEFARTSVSRWIEPLSEALRRGGQNADDASARATAIVSGLRGIAVDSFVTGDRARTDRSAHLLIDSVLGTR